MKLENTSSLNTQTVDADLSVDLVIKINNSKLRHSYLVQVLITITLSLVFGLKCYDRLFYFYPTNLISFRLFDLLVYFYLVYIVQMVRIFYNIVTSSICRISRRQKQDNNS